MLMSPVRKILTDLDTLLDTRLGVIRTIYPAAAATLLANREYWLREYTDWAQLTDGKVTNTQFQAAWEKRGVEVAQHSVVTAFQPVFHKILADCALAGLSGQSQFEVGVEINIWPYDLQHDELDELTSLVRRQLGENVPVTFCSIPLDLLTPELMTTQYAACVSFLFHDWIKLHSIDLTKLKPSGFCYVGPKLFETDPRALTIEQKQAEFTRWRLWYLEYIDFEFIDSSCFSMFNPGRMVPVKA